VDDFHLLWKGAAVERRVLKAGADAINETTGYCVREAKSNHSGWQNQTGTAEGSIQIQEFANPEKLEGKWGSRNVVYFKFLEFLRGHALQSAADLQYPKLAQRIKDRLRAS